MRGAGHLRLGVLPAPHGGGVPQSLAGPLPAAGGILCIPVAEFDLPPMLAAGSAQPDDPVSATGESGDSSAASPPPAMVGGMTPESSASKSSVLSDVVGNGSPNNSAENKKGLC